VIGRIDRFKAVDGLARQTADDLADDILSRQELAGLEEWSVQVLARCRNGTLATKPKAEYWSPGDIELDSKEIPTFLARAWSEPPEVGIRISPSGSPECVTISWYLHGILVGPPDYITTLDPWYPRKVKRGTYTSYFEK
jgi:hypothetical protein